MHTQMTPWPPEIPKLEIASFDGAGTRLPFIPCVFNDDGVLFSLLPVGR